MISVPEMIEWTFYFTTRWDELIGHVTMNPIVTSNMLDNKISLPVGISTTQLGDYTSMSPGHVQLGNG